MNNTGSTQYIEVQAPSNIAFVKYWGKHGRQFPINPSISMTLENCVTTCKIAYKPSDEFHLDSYKFEGQENESFKSRIDNYLRGIMDVYPALQTLSLTIESSNSFPHSSGIASSASAFAALGYALAQIEQVDAIETRASELARLGSGSAARSIQGPYTLWGHCDHIAESSDQYAVRVTDVHPNFIDVRNTILLIETGAKAVSSTDGHALIDNHPFKHARIEQAHQNIQATLSSIKHGDWEQFGTILENEALTLHAMMMTSTPAVILMMPQTIGVMHAVRKFRQETNIPLYFTIDAGANVHLIYPASHIDKTTDFITSHLVHYCKNGQYINDKNGQGARIIHGS